MIQMLGKRLIEFFLFIFLLSLISFAGIKLAPGDAVRQLLRVDDVALTNEQVEIQREIMGLNEPVIVQYGEWLSKFIRLDLGASYMTHRPVIEEIWTRMPATLLLTFTSIVVLIGVAVPLGACSALYPKKWIDRVSRVLAIMGASIPSFWLGLLLIEGFSVRWSIFPAMGNGTLMHLVLPSLTLGLTMAAVYVRLIRSSLLNSLSQDFILGARSRGIGRQRIFWLHACRHSLTPVMTMFGVSVGNLLGGSVVVETIFAYPGLGKFIVEAIHNRDYPMIQGYILFMGAVIMLLHVMTDVTVGYVNPEIRLKEGGH
ncbi:peptide/nickel transport system permease protein [Paenibacillus sp. RC73]|uniref:nickel ABC transporter permease n=1 Tax=Paenibacillus sp. RC73 TaxID=3156250 RepID=UPI003836EE45